jgi:hypothetical protein
LREGLAAALRAAQHFAVVLRNMILPHGIAIRAARARAQPLAREWRLIIGAAAAERGGRSGSSAKEGQCTT